MAKNGKSSKEELIHTINTCSLTEMEGVPLYPTLQENVHVLKQLFSDCSDFVIREFNMKNGVAAVAVFVDGLVDTREVNQALEALMILESGDRDVDVIQKKLLPVSQIAKVKDYKEFLQAVLSGDTGIVVDGNTEALTMGMRGPEKRSVDEPEGEAVVRGPREGFIENIRTNTSLLRRRLKTPRLKMKSLVIGRETNTNVALAYLEGIADPQLVEEVTRRISVIETDGILESGYIEELIQDNIYSPFPQVQYTERPDTVAGALLEGRVAIMVDGTPMVLIVPTTFWIMLQANEDYYERFMPATLIRWLRYLFLLISLLTPAAYVAITTFHQQMLPTTLLLSIAAARESIPFPAIVEALIMEISFEALREAGVRLPKTVGQAVSILGALVVGQAAVEAGIVSAPMVIVVSITGIASFTIPHFNASIALRMLRFPLMIAASILGIYGILVGIVLIMGHLANLRSMGVPYLSPIAPMSVSDLKDVLIRAPWPFMKKRPSFLGVQDARRMRTGQTGQQQRKGQSGAVRQGGGGHGDKGRTKGEG
ncbi:MULTISPECIES: spore germination protein [Bacillales]|jgi:spore germination protein KA/spore germination protein|uniref:spore germination protein n=1 Tax=Brevibacillus TaxID=55080 RepID=UPI001490F688|nr:MULTISPECIES: spore germination protein [Bacillales]MBR8658290.1 spore germination protein [Brevibacillus sp. NL20B1]MDT3414676.1 spore germination protein KA/spore germination protein [Brevibacillus aydinogluensis]NNV01374.1 spore germination protein [Brevibacillus sp. MCWH]UFJ61034.1 spore germination protein [Anoxybacillus sediminis]